MLYTAPVQPNGSRLSFGSMASCFSCGAEYPDNMRVYRQTLCEQCGAEMKVCLNCRFYDPSAQYECRETIPEPVRDKERANFCDFFQLRPGSGATEAAQQRQSKQSQARSQFDSLFGDG